jgi:hypothetical protein
MTYQEACARDCPWCAKGFGFAALDMDSNNHSVWGGGIQSRIVFSPA